MIKTENLSTILFLILIGIALISVVNNSTHEPQKQTIYIYKKLVNVQAITKPINATAIISSTEPGVNSEIVTLSNNLKMNTTDLTLRAGESLQFSYVVISPVCSLDIIYKNGTLVNQTLDTILLSNNYNFSKISNPVCDQMIKQPYITNFKILK